jgi:hypothetical protein
MISEQPQQQQKKRKKTNIPQLSFAFETQDMFSDDEEDICVVPYGSVSKIDIDVESDGPVPHKRPRLATHSPSSPRPRQKRNKLPVNSCQLLVLFDPVGGKQCFMCNEIVTSNNGCKTTVCVRDVLGHLTRKHFEYLLGVCFFVGVSFFSLPF